jgi:hypothetical protein
MRRSFRTRSMGPSGFPGLPPRAGMRCPFRAGSRSAEPRLGRRRKGSGAWLRRRSGILPLCGAFVGCRGLVARGRFHPEVTKLAKRCWGAVVPGWRGVGVLECRGAGVAWLRELGPGAPSPGSASGGREAGPGSDVEAASCRFAGNPGSAQLQCPASKRSDPLCLGCLCESPLYCLTKARRHQANHRRRRRLRRSWRSAVSSRQAASASHSPVLRLFVPLCG